MRLSAQEGFNFDAEEDDYFFYSGVVEGVNGEVVVSNCSSGGLAVCVVRVECEEVVEFDAQVWWDVSKGGFGCCVKCEEELGGGRDVGVWRGEGRDVGAGWWWVDGEEGSDTGVPGCLV